MNTQKSEIAVIFGDISFDLINTKILTGESALRISLNLKLYESMVARLNPESYPKSWLWNHVA